MQVDLVGRLSLEPVTTTFVPTPPARKRRCAPPDTREPESCQPKRGEGRDSCEYLGVTWGPDWSSQRHCFQGPNDGDYDNAGLDGTFIFPAGATRFDLVITTFTSFIRSVVCCRWFTFVATAPLRRRFQVLSSSSITTSSSIEWTIA